MEKYTGILRNCSVNLNRYNFSKIKIKCTAKSEDNTKLATTLKQTDVNTFLIGIKRKNVYCEENSPKRMKIHHDVSKCRYLNCICTNSIYCNSKNGIYLSINIYNHDFNL